MPKLILNREGEWINRNRAFKVWIDGVQRGTIKNKDAEEYIVEPGLHMIECKIDWLGSEPLDVMLNEGETKYVKMQSGMKCYWLFYTIFLAGVLGNIFVKRLELTVPAWLKIAVASLMILGFVYLLYYLVIGRKKYLLLTEVKDFVFSK